MRLYHGTSAALLPKILKAGLEPRGRKIGNWDHTVNSHPEAVYLTDAYAPYFAVNAAKKGEGGLIIECDTEKFHTLEYLVPDEDVVAQIELAVEKREGTQSKDSLIQRTKKVRRRLKNYCFSDGWQASLRAMGTCASFAPIRPEEITRIAVVAPEDCASLLWNWDASIALINYRILGPRYRAQTARLFGDAVPESELKNILWDDPRVALKAKVLKLEAGKVVSEYQVDMPDERLSVEERMKRLNALRDEREAQEATT